MRHLVGIVRKYKEELSLVGVLALYCVLAYVFSVPCPIKYVSGVSCPGCGMTRAIMSLLRLDFAGALYYHPLIFLVILGLPCYAVFRRRGMTAACRALAAVFVAVMLAVYIYRMLFAEVTPLVFRPEEGLIARLINKVT